MFGGVGVKDLEAWRGHKGTNTVGPYYGLYKSSLVQSMALKHHVTPLVDKS